jgi:hypothetical protein
MIVEKPMARPISIPLSFVELVVRYEHPNVRAFNDRATILQTIFDALLPWSPKLDDVEPVTTGKISDQGLIFRLPLKQISIFFGPVFCRFSRDNVDWTEAGETIKIFEAALSALMQLTGLASGGKHASVGVHLQPKAGTFMDILGPFMPPQITAIEEDSPRTMASIVRWNKRVVTLDGSGSLANAAFLKFEREFEAGATFTDIAGQILEDEKQLFAVLNVEEVRP